MSSYYTEKHHHSRRRELPVAGTVLRRVEVRRPSLEKSPPPAPAPPSVKEPTKEPPKEPKKEEPKEESKEPSKEKEAASPPAPEWSKWEPIEGAGWDGHWRAKATEDGGWVYQFTKEFKTIWEQKPVEAAPSAKSSPASASASAAASAPPAGEPVRFEETAAPATAATTAIQPLEQPPPSANYETAGSGCACALCYYDAAAAAAAAASAAALSSLQGDVAALTLSGNRDASHLHQYEYTQATTATEIPPSAAEQGLVAAGQASYPTAAVNPSQEVSHRHSPGAASAARSRGSKKSSRHYSHSTHKSAHHRAHGPDKAAHNPKEIGDVVSAEKEKKYDPKRIVDNWVWDPGHSWGGNWIKLGFLKNKIRIFSSGIRSGYLAPLERRGIQGDQADREKEPAQQRSNEATGGTGNTTEERKHSTESPATLPLQGVALPRTLRSEPIIVDTISPMNLILPHLSRWTSEKADIPSPPGHPAVDIPPHLRHHPLLTSTHFDHDDEDDEDVRHPGGDVSPCSSPSPSPSPSPRPPGLPAPAPAENTDFSGFLFFDSPSSRSSTRRPSTRDSSAPRTALSMPPPHRPPPRRRHTRAGGQGRIGGDDGAARSNRVSGSSLSGGGFDDGGGGGGEANSARPPSPPPPLPVRDAARSKSLHNSERPAVWI
ncbi:hypothetical protein INS49_014969 [Diaporthe citri]|uniref:uncharacterized protein n=1 Tax=Diaporthe citri TaxID=83186 RepID=UPI001C81CBFD|nr:uncharacterized protein INS49_014969 [Diaporthe citri]KAG6357092.1 hypothetical protein INS49_014969 [Diaporthe citri]